MSERVLIVDGYNVIKNHDRYGAPSVDLEAARLKLTEDLLSLAGFTGGRIVLVFDGTGGSSGSVEARKVGPVEVLFSGPEDTADQVIERAAFDIKQAGATLIQVATADYDLQKTVFKSDVYRLSPDELVEEIDQAFEEYRSRRPERESQLKARLSPDIIQALDGLFDED